MDLTTFHELLSPAGQAALRDAQSLLPTDAGFLASFEKLRKHHPPALAKAALETVLLRARARAKFAAADRMYFTREALEQATGDLAANHRVKRLAPFGAVADLCSGIGGDALAMAAAGLAVHAVEIDPLRLAIAEANARALGLSGRIAFHLGDVLTVRLPEVRAAFVDPGRRAGMRRHLDPERYSPPLSALRNRFADLPLSVKVAPGVNRKDVADLGAEVEFVSVEGELKECVLWFGALRTAARSATLLPAGVSLAADEPPPLLPVAPLCRYLFDPDAAVVRAGLAGLLAKQLSLAPIDHTVMLFTGDKPVESPFITAYRIEPAQPFKAAVLRDLLRERGVGRVTIVKRGSSIDADELVRKLKLAGRDHRVVVLTRAAGEPVMILGERATSSSP